MNGHLKTAIPAAFGAAIVIVLHVRNGWWLDEGGRVAVMLIVVACASALVTLFGANALWLWCGLFAAMTMILIGSGGGTIWPIVLVIGGGMAGAAVLTGFGVGALLRKVFAIAATASTR